MAEIFCYCLMAILAIVTLYLFFATMYLVDMDKQTETQTMEVNEPELPCKSLTEDVREIWACCVACLVLLCEKLGVVKYNEDKKKWEVVK